MISCLHLCVTAHFFLIFKPFLFYSISVSLIKGEFSQKHNLFRTDGIFCS